MKKFIQYMLSPEGQVKSANMAAYPANIVTNKGRKALQDKDPKEAKRSNQVDGAALDPVKLIKDGRVHYRDIRSSNRSKIGTISGRNIRAHK